MGSATKNLVNSFHIRFFSVVILSAIQGTSFSMARADTDPTYLRYQGIDFSGNEAPSYDLFQQAMIGYNQLDTSHRLANKNIITIIDFRKSSNQKRLWVIDLQDKKLLYFSLAAHGRNSGEVFARKFSNTPNSNTSSLGFYVTGKTYIGKHGISLKLHGVEPDINDKAESRAIVMHGASYVSDAFIKKFGRLGRSFGCPAVPMELYETLIPKIADGTCLFIFYPDPDYLAQTKFRKMQGDI